MLFPVNSGPEGLEKALDYLFMLADEAIEQGVNIFILSDRGVSRDMAPIPALLATAGLHHHLIRRETRTQCAIVVESGEPREVHHFALLIGYGATAVNPYMAYETIYDMIDQGLVTDIAYEKAKYNYIKASQQGRDQGLLQDGHQHLQSYCGAQIFEALGVEPGAGRQVLHLDADAHRGHRPARDLPRGAAGAISAPTPNGDEAPGVLVSGGDYQWRADGERHLFTPITIHKLQAAVRTRGDEVWNRGYKTFKEYSRAGQRAGRGVRHAAWPARTALCRPADSAGRGRTGQRDRQALQDRRHELRLHLARRRTRRWRSP